jgi:hypothetical protein
MEIRQPYKVKLEHNKYITYEIVYHQSSKSTLEDPKKDYQNILVSESINAVILFHLNKNSTSDFRPIANFDASASSFAVNGTLPV